MTQFLLLFSAHFRLFFDIPTFSFRRFYKKLLLFSTQLISRCCYSWHIFLLLFTTHLRTGYCYSRHISPHSSRVVIHGTAKLYYFKKQSVISFLFLWLLRSAQLLFSKSCYSSHSCMVVIFGTLESPAYPSCYLQHRTVVIRDTFLLLSSAQNTFFI